MTYPGQLTFSDFPFNENRIFHLQILSLVIWLSNKFTRNFTQTPVYEGLNTAYVSILYIHRSFMHFFQSGVPKPINNITWVLILEIYWNFYVSYDRTKSPFTSLSEILHILKDICTRFLRNEYFADFLVKF